MVASAGQSESYVLWRGGGASISSYLPSTCTVVTEASLGTSTSATAAYSAQGFGGGRVGQSSTLYQCVGA